jgi:uncharacterized protein with PQ loop repeat
MNYDLIGYLATALVLVSFLMKDIIKLRIINSIGCLLFTLYGILLGSWPVIITNGAILLINIYFLVFTTNKSMNQKQQEQ